MIIKKTGIDFSVSHWSGGSTTELFLHPTNGSFKDREFEFRISVATVNDEFSTFTALPGIKRNLTVLEGGITLTHQDQYSKTLGKFESDQFEGEWQTSSVGRCTDFNLMIKKGWIGTVEPQIIPQNQVVKVEKPQGSWIYIYVWKGELQVKAMNQLIEIQQNELICIQKFEEIMFELTPLSDTEFLIVKMKKGN